MARAQTSAAPSWVADDGVLWWVGLTAAVDPAPAPEVALERLRRLATRQGWTPPDTVEIGADPLRLLADLCSRPPDPPIRLGLAGRYVVLAGQHSHVDGLGMLAVLAAVVDQPVTSSARGLGHRDERGSVASGTLRRLAEAILAPPGRVARSGGSDGPDRIVVRTVDGTVSAADLVCAGAAGLAAYNRTHGTRTRRVAVAVGASRRPGTSIEPANHSALLRLRNVERLTRDEVRGALRAAAPEPDPSAAGGGRLVARAMSIGLRVLAPRLGSTLLVSHLGTVTAPGAEEVLLHPVTAGGSGLSLGAGDDGRRTVLSLRARARTHDDDALEEILEGIVGALARG